MPKLSELREAAARQYSAGHPEVAVQLYDAIVAAAPLDFEARTRVADCLLQLGDLDAAEPIYRAVHGYALRSGHPLAAVVCARLLQAHGRDASGLVEGLVATYGQGSGKLGKLAARVASPAPSTEIPAPELQREPSPAALAQAATRAVHATDAFAQWPEALHPIPLLSELSESALRRVLDTVLLRRLPSDALVFRQGDEGSSFFFVASGEVAITREAGGATQELARLGENAIFGEMALLTARPRSATARAVGEVDLLELGRSSLAALAQNIEGVALALHHFTRDRLLSNVMVSSPLFRALDSGQRRELLRRFTSHDVTPGAVIIGEGEPGRGLFVVLSGQLEASRCVGDRVVELGALSIGDVFGEIALLRGGVTTATVTAVEHATVLFLAQEYVERLLAAIPELRRCLEEVAASREIDNQLTAGFDEVEVLV
ncbi:MAG: cyclic nucleotide-binding domain-containing protein [Kofleriaceae bacterium]